MTKDSKFISPLRDVNPNSIVTVSVNGVAGAEDTVENVVSDFDKAIINARRDGAYIILANMSVVLSQAELMKTDDEEFNVAINDMVLISRSQIEVAAGAIKSGVVDFSIDI